MLYTCYKVLFSSFRHGHQVWGFQMTFTGVFLEYFCQDFANSKLIHKSVMMQKHFGFEDSDLSDSPRILVFHIFVLNSENVRDMPSWFSSSNEALKLKKFTQPPCTRIDVKVSDQYQNYMNIKNISTKSLNMITIEAIHREDVEK